MDFIEKVKLLDERLLMPSKTVKAAALTVFEEDKFISTIEFENILFITTIMCLIDILVPYRGQSPSLKI